MAEEIKDKLEARIARRREEAARARGEIPATVPPVELVAVVAPVAAGKNFAPESYSLAQRVAIKDLRDAIALRQNAMTIARKLALLVTNRGMRSQVAAALDRTPSWVTKKLLLLEAPKEIQALIERGELAESAYYDDRVVLVASVKGRGAGVRLEREPRGKVSKTAMLNIAVIFKELVATYGLAPIRIGDAVSMTALEYILNTRAGEILAAIKAEKNETCRLEAAATACPGAACRCPVRHAGAAVRLVRLPIRDEPIDRSQQPGGLRPDRDRGPCPSAHLPHRLCGLRAAGVAQPVRPAAAVLVRHVAALPPQ